MRPGKRYGVSKHKSARGFRKQVGKTQPLNFRPGVMRGGIRL